MSFEGFPKELQTWLKDLKSNNDKAWFEARRGDYEALFLEPAKGFVEAIGDRLDAIMPGLAAEPKVNGSIRRINRDTRFSKDKSPYHDHLHLIFWKGAKATAAPGFHLVIAADHVGFGSGQWGLEGALLARYRDIIMSDEGARSLRAAIAEAEAIPGQSLDDAALKRPPKGFDGAPDPDLLRYKGLVVRGDLADPAPLFGAGAVDHMLELCRAHTPLVRWLDEHLGAA